MARQLLMGNEAMALAALEAGVRVAAGYPGTPSSEIIETIAARVQAGAAHGVHVEWSTNEKVALEVLGGAAEAGARCLFTCKQVGLNVAADSLLSQNYVGVVGGLVLIAADDPGPISSQTEQDTRRFAAFAKVPVLDPATPEQAYLMVKEAFALSERYGTPVIVRPTTRIDHASAFFEVPAETHAHPLIDGGFARDPDRWVIFPRRSYQAHGQINQRLAQMACEFSGACDHGAKSEAAESSEGSAAGAALRAADAPRQAAGAAYATFNPCWEGGGRESAASADRDCARLPRVGVLAGGVSAAYAQDALTMLQQRARLKGVCLPHFRFMQVGTAYPFPAAAVERFARGLDTVLVYEELDHVLEDELLRLAGQTHGAFEVQGKLTGHTRDRGENDVDDAVVRIARLLEVEGLVAGSMAGSSDEGAAPAPTSPLDLDAIPDLPLRPPTLCPGCPHRGSFVAVKRALGRRPAVLCGDIGCYTLGNAHPLDALDTCLCMGAGITMAQGFSVVHPDRKAIAYIGDSTFFASGLPGLANAAYNGHDVTVVVLDNATTAMTGTQPHPGTGLTLMGACRPPLSIEAELRANGIELIAHADPLDLEKATEAARRAIEHPGPSAVLFVSPCVQVAHPQPSVRVDQGACTGCRTCIASIGCPAIGFDAGIDGPRSKGRGQAYVDQTLCFGCDLCAQVCPFDAFVPAGSRTADQDKGASHA
ncbi:4Fe-4S binding protein [Eggerthellaceae bacterium zg-997]|nr:4Fe-4S binding protein [Eggerthellaceae bacterium zg-997]